MFNRFLPLIVLGILMLFVDEVVSDHDNLVYSYAPPILAREKLAKTRVTILNRVYVPLYIARTNGITVYC